MEARTIRFAAVAAAAAMVVAASAVGWLRGSDLPRFGLPVSRTGLHPSPLVSAGYRLGASPAPAQPAGVVVEDAAFASDHIGWITTSDGGQNRLMATTDGGHSWTTQLSWNGNGQLAFGKLTCFDDSECVVVLQPSDGRVNSYSVGRAGQPVVLHTRDAGEHWVAGGSLPDGFTGRLAFLTVETGWVLVNPSARDGLDLTGPNVRLMQTTDAGASWSEIARTDGSHGLPPADYSGVAFRTPLDGYLAGGTRLFATHDGGRIWAPQPIELPAGLPLNRLSASLEPPVFSGRRFAMLVLDVWLDHDFSRGGPAPTQPPEAGQWAYLSDSDLWGSPVRLPTVRSWSFAAVAAQAGDGQVWAASDQDVWNSTDHGAHWNHLHAPLPAGHFVGKLVPIGAAGVWLVSVRFPRPEDPRGQGLLYRTDSGGRHWADVGPTQSGQ